MAFHGPRTAAVFPPAPGNSNPNGVGGRLGNVDPSVPGSFGGDGLTPDVAAANPVIGSGGPRAIQLGLKVKF
jgi:hypothetical protein